MEKKVTKTLLNVKHRTKTLLAIISVFLSVFSTSYAQPDPIPIGGGGGVYTGPIGGNGDGFPPIFLPEPLTPPCNVSDNCNEVPSYMPVWRQGPNNTVLECPSPLFVRKDAYTCNHIVRQTGVSETIDPNGGGIIDPLTGGDPNCSACNIGFVGINAIKPLEQLHVRGNVRCDDGMFMGNIQTSNIYGVVKNDPDGVPNSGDEEYETIQVQAPVNVQNNLTATSAAIGTLNVTSLNTNSDVNSYNLNVSNNAYIRKLSIGNLTNGIPKRPNGAFGNYALSVDGTIVCARLQAQQTSWADKVFHKNYKLMTLSEIEAFVTQYKHLPEIPSEQEVLENGIDVGEMNKLLLQKVEELTLHLIAQNKKLEALETKMKKLAK